MIIVVCRGHFILEALLYSRKQSKVKRFTSQHALHLDRYDHQNISSSSTSSCSENVVLNNVSSLVQINSVTSPSNNPKERPPPSRRMVQGTVPLPHGSETHWIYCVVWVWEYTCLFVRWLAGSRSDTVPDGLSLIPHAHYPMYNVAVHFISHSLLGQ